ncbi:hypothetical protein [Pseudomonas viridiflava]|uniref:hypothetical protein n=1 Tax=Pseudomonas syringae group TaxID=136849 RepID=UPI001F1216D4|nr:hypothetical protein [Pseudomonas viridiflava]
MTVLDKDIPPRNRKAGPGKGRPAAAPRNKKDPHAALHAPVRPPRFREKRNLSTDQLKNPLLRMAFSRLSQMPELRGKYLRSLDTIHGSRRTRSEPFVALSRVAEQLLVRLDLATGVLGWLDVERGQFFLNTQCGVAEDSDISPASLNRLIRGLELAGLVYRRIEKVRLDEKNDAGLNLVRTRCLVRFTEKFFAELGCRYLWHKAKKAAIKKRERQLREVGARNAVRQEKASLEALRREESRRNWQQSEARKASPDAQASPSATSQHRPPLTPGGCSEGPDDALARLLRSVQVKKDT